MAIELSYSDVENVLAKLNRVGDDKRVAFKARLKHLQRLGFPPGANTGTGKRVVYSASMLLQMALATELTQAGMSPKRIVDILDKNWQYCEPGFWIALSPDTSLARWSPEIKDNHMLMILSPEALRELSEDGESEFDYHESVEVIPISGLEAYMLNDDASPVVGEFYRHLIIQLKPLAFRVIVYLIECRPDIEAVMVWRDLEEKLVAEGKKQQAMFAEFDKVLGVPGRGDDT